MIAAGDLTHRIDIQAMTSTPSYTGPVETWTSLHQCWASIDVQNSQLVTATVEFVSKRTYRIVIRWTPSEVFSAKQRIIFIEPTTSVVHTYEIKAIVNDKMANDQLMFLCYDLGGPE